MSKYTTQLRYICENFADNKEHPYREVHEVIEAAIPKIFDFDVPVTLPDGVDKSTILHDQFFSVLRHFYMREIGEETYGLWKLRLEDAILTNIVRLNHAYYVFFAKADPLHEYESHSESVSHSAHDNDSDSTRMDKSGSINVTSGHPYSKTQSSNDDLSKFSDTPEGALQNVKDGTYLTNATHQENLDLAERWDTLDTRVESHGDGMPDVTKGHDAGTTDGDTKTDSWGRNKSAGELLAYYRDHYTDMDDVWFDILEPLFIQLW